MTGVVEQLTVVVENLTIWIPLVSAGCLLGVLSMTAMLAAGSVAERLWPKRVGRHRAGWQLMDGGLR